MHCWKGIQGVHGLAGRGLKVDQFGRVTENVRTGKSYCEWTSWEGQRWVHLYRGEAVNGPAGRGVGDINFEILTGSEGQERKPLPVTEFDAPCVISKIN